MSDEAKEYTSEEVPHTCLAAKPCHSPECHQNRVLATVRALEAERAAHEKAERERDEARARVAQLEEALRQSNKYIDEAVARRLEWFEAQQRRFGIGSAEAKAASKSAHDVVNSTRNSFDSVARALSTSPSDWLAEHDRSIAERQREACAKAAALAPNCELHEHGPCEWDGACDAIAELVRATPLVMK